jgi:hypothetical protein
MTTPFGLCRCGCGGKTTIVKYSNRSAGIVGGMPRGFIKGHARRLSPVDYVIEDRGYKTPCWIWQLGTKDSGYGVLTRGRKRMGAHKWYWQQVNGPVPDGLQLDHLCRIHPCVNPEHLEPVTGTENLRRGKSAKLTDESVRQIRYLRSQRQTLKGIAEIIGVSASLVSRVVLGRTRAEVV